MAVPRLADYIKTQLNSGYDINTIRNYLIRYGYDRREVEEAVSYIYGKKEKKIPNWAIIGVVILGILFLIILMVVIFSGEEQQPAVVIQQPVVSPPVVETSPVVEQPVQEEQEQILDLDSQNTEVPLPQCPPSCNDFNDCTRDYCGVQTAYQCVNEDIVPCCGNNFCDSGEDSTSCPGDCQGIVSFPSTGETLTDIINKARDLAESNPNSAANYCDGLDDESYKDTCYVNVAEVSEDSSYCDGVVSNAKKDSCYTTAALNNDFTVCEKMTNEYLRLSCENLAAASS